MTQIMRLQDEYRKNHDLLNGYKTAEDYERDFMSIMNTNRAEGREEGIAETTFAFVSAMLKKYENVRYNGIIRTYRRKNKRNKI